jgi:hypothetical protein
MVITILFASLVYDVIRLVALMLLRRLAVKKGWLKN